LGQVKS